MIEGKATLNFGIGDIMITPLCNDYSKKKQLGAICFNQSEPGLINRSTIVENQDFSRDASVIMTFSKTESIDVLIENLIWLKNTMNGETPESDRIGWDEPFNLNIIFKEEEEMKEKSWTFAPEYIRYASVILEAPEAKEVVIHIFEDKESAQVKSDRLKKWTYKKIVKARDEKGRFTKGFALICCK